MFEVHRQNHGVCTQCPQRSVGTDAAETGRLRLVRAFIQTPYGIKAPDLGWQPWCYTTTHTFCDKVKLYWNMVYRLIISHSTYGFWMLCSQTPTRTAPGPRWGASVHSLISHYIPATALYIKKWLLRKLAGKIEVAVKMLKNHFLYFASSAARVYT